MRILYTFSLTAILACIALPGMGQEASASWVPASCSQHAQEIREIHPRANASEDHKVVWQRYRAEVLRAKPGDPKYVPYPYPQNPAQVLEDLRYAFLDRRERDSRRGNTHTRDAVPPHRRKAHEILRQESPEYRVHRVENWKPGPCRANFEVPFYFLVQLFDQGEEVGRAALYDSGIWAQFSPVPAEPWPLEDLQRTAEIVSQRFGLDLPSAARLNPQYVTTEGLPLQCLATLPCVAFRVRETTYLINRDHSLFRISAGANQRGIPEMAREGWQEPSPGSTWVSVGFGYREAHLERHGPRGQAP